MFVIKDVRSGEFVSTSSPHWLNLLDGTTTNKEYATQFATKEQAEDFMRKLMRDGFDFAGDDVCDMFEIEKF